MNNKEIHIGVIDFNTSCSCDTNQYPYGLIMFGTYHKQCEDKLTGIKIIIKNDTEEGKTLYQMLKEEVEVDKIEEFIFGLVIKYKTISEIRECLNEQIKQNYNDGVEEGKKKKIMEIRNVLEI